MANPIPNARSQLGIVDRTETGYVLRYERRLQHSIDRVWAALTEPDELIGWLAEAELELSEGGPIVLRWQNSDEDGNQAVLRGTITRLDPPRLLEYEGDIHGLLRWELREDGDGCVLTFTNESPVPEDMAASVLGGWHIHLDHLEEALAGGRVEWESWDADHRPRWAEYHARYEAMLD